MRDFLLSLTTTITLGLINHDQPKILAWLDKQRINLTRKR